METNTLEAKRGRIAYRVRRENNSVIGSNPTDIVIYLADPLDPRGRSVFAEITDEASLEVLDLIAETEADVPEEKPAPSDPNADQIWPPKGSAWKIKSVQTTGTPEVSPLQPLERELIMPTVPEESDDK